MRTRSHRVGVVYGIARREEESVMTRLIVSRLSVSEGMQYDIDEHKPICSLEYGSGGLDPRTWVQGIRAGKFDESQLIACAGAVGSRVSHKRTTSTVHEG